MRKYSYARICSIGRAFRESATFMSFLTGQSKDHGKASCEQPGDEEAGSPTTNCWEAKTFSFPVDFFPNLLTIDWDLRIPLPPE